MSNTIRRRNTHRAWGHAAPKASKVAGAPAVVPVRRAPTRNERDWLVTDHAVLRWLERVTGIDVARQVRDEILAEGREELIPKVGNGKICLGDIDAVLQIVAGRVVTVKVRAPSHG